MHTMEGGLRPDSENDWKFSPLQTKRKKLKIMRDGILTDKLQVNYLISKIHFPPLKTRPKRQADTKGHTCGS